MKRWIVMVSVGLVLILSMAGLAESNRRAMEETRKIGRCLVEQLAEHRIDNRGSHETLSDQHNDVAGDRVDTGLPEPPITLPRPNPEVQEELLAACEGLLHRSRVGPP